MRDRRVEALAAAIAVRRDDPDFRRAYADLRETVASAIDPRVADRELARLLVRHPLDSKGTPVSARFESVLRLFPGGEAREPQDTGYDEVREPEGPARLLAEGLETLLHERLDLRLSDGAVLDPWAGTGNVVAAVAVRGGTTRLHANEADPLHYARAGERLGPAFDRLCLADSFRLPDRRPTPAFAFSDDENTERIVRQQEVEFSAIVADLRGATRPDARATRRIRETYGKGIASVRWMTDRLAPEGMIAFLSDEEFVDEPAFTGMRAELEREFSLVAHLALPDGLGLTFLVRGGKARRLLYAKASTLPHAYATVAWTELQPTERHVWRTEILRPEWAEFLPLAGERGAIFSAVSTGMADGHDAATPGAKGARRVLRRPFAPVWRTFDRKARREPTAAEGPTIVVLGEPFGVLASTVPVDRRFGGSGASVMAVGGAVSATAMRRFRTTYGAEVVERDVFEATLALLHHPEYQTRYYEDLRRGAPRLPLLPPGQLESLLEEEDAPAVGPGTAFGTGWLTPDLFDPGVLPDYDDPFASPYGRSDVAPGFLLLVALGAALFRLQTDFGRLRPHPTADGVPPEASAWRIGRKTALEWAGQAARSDAPEASARLRGQVVAAALEMGRLVSILEAIRL